MGKTFKPPLAPDPAIIMASMPDGAPPAPSPAQSPFRPHGKRPDNWSPDPYPGVIPFIIGASLFD